MDHHHQPRWSELPEDIIHRLFSTIATTREAARLCLLSKSWLHAWNSYIEDPSFVFIEKESSSAKKLNQFYRFVENTVTKFTTDQPNTKIRKLVLESVLRSAQKSSDNVRDNVSDMTLLISKKINVLLKNSSWINWLHFSGHCCRYERPPDLDLSDLVNFPSLRSLTLPKTTLVSSRTVERFLKRCPLLETLRCGAVYTPNKTRGTTLLGDSKLKHLDLEIAYFTAEPLKEFLSELGFLETLKITLEPCRRQLVMISNESVRNIEMHIRGWIGEVIIDAPMLSCFRYTDHMFHWFHPERLLISMNPTNDCRSHITVPFYNNIKFLNDLSGLMCFFGELRTLAINYRAEVSADKDNEVEAIPSPAVDQIEGFNILIEASSFIGSYTDVLDQVLRICRPSILTVITSGDWELMSGYEMLMNREEEFKCRCSDNVNYCWKHQLKNVLKIDDIKASNKLQSTYACLKLKW